MKGLPNDPEKLAHRLFSVASPRIYYLVIPKCGCTFVKNVLWNISKGEFHANQMRIHDSDMVFLRAPDVEADVGKIRHEEAAFAVVRNPIDRFLSLYFDKIIGNGRREYVPLYKTLVEKHRLVEVPVTGRDNLYNLEVLANWLAENLRGGTDLHPEAHWTPQSYRFNILQQFDLKILTVDTLTLGLNLLLSPLVPDVDQILSKAEMNRSARLLRKRDYMTVDLRRKVNSVYSRDRAFYLKAKAYWDSMLVSEPENFEVPRYTSFISRK